MSKMEDYVRERTRKEPIEVTGVWLVRRGDKACVLVEVDGRWVEIIEEHVDGPFSHICEPGGVTNRIAQGRFYAPAKTE